jgi:hypothetical protein
MAVAFSGCNDILDDQAAQPGLVGSVTITTKRCFFGGRSATPPYTCDAVDSFTEDHTVQGLIAYQVPSAVREPATFTGVTDAPGDVRTIAYTFDQSYTDALQATSPAPPGEKWRGYISQVETYTVAQEVAQVETIRAGFEMPPGPGGSPAHGPFRWLTIIGMRYVNDTDLLATRPVGGCGPTLSSGYTTPGQATPIVDTDCMDWPSALPSLSTLATSDFGITAPAPQTTQAGTSVDVPFGWELAGPAIGAPFALRAGTDAPGADPTPADGTLSPGSDSTGTELVHLAVPAATRAGDYNVTLTAALANGQVRSKTTSLHVTAAADSSPSVSNHIPSESTGPGLTLARVRRQSLRSALARGLRLDLGCAEPCDIAVSLLLAAKKATQLHLGASKPVRIGGRRISLRSAGQLHVRVPFTRKAKRRLRAARAVSLVVKLVAVDRAGHTGATTRGVRLR